MFVTNLASHPLGVDGIVILKPKEKDRFIEETHDLVTRVNRLKKLNLVSVRYEEGLVKDGKPTTVDEKPKANKAKVEKVTEPEVTTETVITSDEENSEKQDAEEVPAAKPKTRGGKSAK